MVFKGLVGKNRALSASLLRLSARPPQPCRTLAADSVGKSIPLSAHMTEVLGGEVILLYDPRLTLSLLNRYLFCLTRRFVE